MAAAQYYEQIQQAYLAYYGRPADPQGLVYWATQLDNAGGNLNAIINAFGTSAESESLYGSTPGAAQIAAIYQQLFGRAPDATGLTFYVNGLATGQFTLASIALNIYNGASGTDLTALQSKLAYADAFTNALESSVDGQIAYSGNAAAANARTAVSGVTDSASEATAAANISTTISNIGAGTVGQTYTLTTGVDTVTLTGNNDVVNGTINDLQATSTTNATLTAGDTITAAAGSTGNVLNITDETGNSSLPTVSVSGIQTVNFTVGGPAGDVDFSGFSGLNTLNVKEAGGASDIIASSTTDVNLTDSNLNNNEIYVDGGSNVTITANGVGEGDIYVGNNTAATGAVTVTANGVNDGDIYVGYSVPVSGTVNVTETTAAVAAGSSVDGSYVDVWGGSTVTVTENLTSTVAKGATTHGTVYGGEVYVYGTTDTTSVTVNQSAAVTGQNATATTATVNTVVDGYVNIEDVNGGTANLGTITSVTLNNFSGGAYIEDNALTTLTIGGTAGGLEIDDNGGLATPVTTLALNVNALTGDTTVTEDAGAVKTLDIVTGGASASTLTFADTGLTTVNLSGSQNINLTTTNTVGNAAVYATAINVSGAAGITTAIGAATAFDSTGTGNDVLTLNGALTKTSGGSITFGSGDNSLLAGTGASIGTGVTIDGGTSGHNTISASLLANSVGATIEDFQIADLSGYNGTLDTSLLATPISSLSITTANTTGSTLEKLAAAVTLTDTFAGDASSLNLTHSGTTSNSLAVNFADATSTSTSTQSLTIISTDDAAVTVSSGGTKFDTNTLSLTETDNHLGTVTISGANALTFGTAVTAGTPAVTTYTNGVSTDSALTTATANVASSLQTIDGSAATGALHIVAGQSTAISTSDFDVTYTGLSILGGTGGDTIVNLADKGTITEGATAATTGTHTAVNTLTVTGSAASINDSASAANDTINLSGFGDSATLGSGGSATAGTAVTVNVADDATATGTTSETTTVTFGSGVATVNDNLHFNASGDVLALNGNVSGNTLAFADGNTLHFASDSTGTALGAAATITNTSNSLTFAQLVSSAESQTASTATWFQFGGNTYVVESGAASGTPSAPTLAGAQVVKITGLVDLSHDTFHVHA